MLEAPPQLAAGQREIAIMVDAETGVAGKIHPGSVVDIIATYSGSETAPAQAEVVVPGARVIDVGVTVTKGDGKVQQQDAQPQSVVPVTFALTPEQDLAVTHAESFASEVRLALLRPGDLSELTKKQRDVHPQAMSHRLLLAIGDDALASSAAALAAEGRSSRSSTASPIRRT